MDYVEKVKKEGRSCTIGSRFKQSCFIREEKGSKMQLIIIELTPGPNAYNPKVFTTEQAASLKGQHKEFTSNPNSF